MNKKVQDVECGSFTLSLTGLVCYKRLASLIIAKGDVAWIRCSLSLSLLRSSIQYIRGAHSTTGHAAKQPFPPLELVSSEVRLLTLNCLSELYMFLNCHLIYFWNILLQSSYRVGWGIFGRRR